CISTATAICIPFGLHHGISEHLHPVGLHHVSRIFEEDIDIVNEVQRHIKNGSDMALLSKDIAKEMDDAYSVIDEAPQSNIHAEVKSTCYSDDSDSEVFRVKRGSSIKPQHRKAINFVPSKPEHQMTGLDHLEPHVEKKEPVWIVFEVLGSVELASYLNVSSYKTIDGQGQRIKFTGKGLRLKECEHVIVCNLEFEGGRGPDVDAIQIKRNSKHIWIRCSLQDYDDGLIDIIEKAQILPFPASALRPYTLRGARELETNATAVEASIWEEAWFFRKKSLFSSSISTFCGASVATITGSLTSSFLTLGVLWLGDRHLTLKLFYVFKACLFAKEGLDGLKFVVFVKLDFPEARSPVFSFLATFGVVDLGDCSFLASRLIIRR
ncbi:probable pectate lyase 4, partial [Tanacetum coccineum]